jgi:NAD(P)-dependent dehydrogenase (short-subunit alcohol dehydrogenase family)
VAIAYLSEDEDAKRTAELVEAEGRRAITLRCDVQKEDEARGIVTDTVEQLGKLDVLVNHAGTQTPVDSPEEITTEQLEGTFKTNVYGPWWSTHEALKHLPEDGSASIINTGSVNGLRGNKDLIDYAASKGAIHVLTFSLAQALVERKIRVNCVAPGPVWTPLIPATFPREKVESFGQQVPMERAAQPDEIAPSYVFFASEQLSSYYSRRSAARRCRAEPACPATLRSPWRPPLTTPVAGSGGCSRSPASHSPRRSSCRRPGGLRSRTSRSCARCRAAPRRSTPTTGRRRTSPGTGATTTRSSRHYCRRCRYPSGRC